VGLFMGFLSFSSSAQSSRWVEGSDLEHTTREDEGQMRSRGEQMKIGSVNEPRLFTQNINRITISFRFRGQRGACHVSESQ
jgi:hypothetical protein